MDSVSGVTKEPGRTTVSLKGIGTANFYEGCIVRGARDVRLIVLLLHESAVLLRNSSVDAYTLVENDVSSRGTRGNEPIGPGTVFDPVVVGKIWSSMPLDIVVTSVKICDVIQENLVKVVPTVVAVSRRSNSIRVISRTAHGET